MNRPQAFLCLSFYEESNKYYLPSRVEDLLGNDSDTVTLYGAKYCMSHLDKSKFPSSVIHSTMHFYNNQISANGARTFFNILWDTHLQEMDNYMEKYEDLNLGFLPKFRGHFRKYEIC